MRYIKIIILGTFCIFNACNKSDKTIKQNSNTKQIPAEYVELFEIMRNGFIDRDKIDWNSLEEKVLAKSKISKDSAIIEAITLLGNKHTHYVTKDGRLLRGRFAKPIVDSACLLKVYDNNKLTRISNAAYINIKRHGYKKTIIDSEYIFNNLKIISEHANSDNWIIDLRDNTGGSNWVMINSIIPFFNDGILGYTKINESEIPWTIKDGALFSGINNMTSEYVGQTIKYTIHPKKIYVLTNHKTSSAGEATLISLKSLPNVKILGKKTSGDVTINSDKDLLNGDNLRLTAGYMMDNNKKTYPNGIQPDYEFCTEDEILKYIQSDIKK